MSTINAFAHDHDHGHEHAGDHAHAHGHIHADLSEANTAVPAGWGKGPSLGLMGIGILCILATLVPVFTGLSSEGGKEAAKLAMSAYHVGYIAMLTMVLGPLALVLIFNLVKAGWAVTIRRQLENMASLIPLALLLLVPIVLATVIKPDILFKWMSSEVLKSDPILQHKAAFLNPIFFYIRLAIYFTVWIYLANRLAGNSRKQDTTGDKQLTVSSGLTSAWGILAFALTAAFASFDLVKSLDYHWFSTMFGVYFFAGSMVAGLATLVLVLTALRGAGRLQGLVTEEHLHDLGKLMLGFCIFWAYVAFSQYFLIWYANVPEETAYFILRKNNGWQYVGVALIIGHFVLPFLFLLWRGSKRRAPLIAFAAIILLVMHSVDAFYNIRPVVYAAFDNGGAIKGKIGFSWVDLTGVLGPVCLYLGLLIRKIASTPLIPLKDPRLPEAVAHKNYI